MGVEGLVMDVSIRVYKAERMITRQICGVQHGLNADHPTAPAKTFTEPKLIIAAYLPTADNATRRVAAVVKPKVVIEVLVRPAATDVSADVATRPEGDRCWRHDGRRRFVGRPHTEVSGIRRTSRQYGKGGNAHKGQLSHISKPPVLGEPAAP